MSDSVFEKIEQAVKALYSGMRRVELESEGYKITAYFITEKQIRIDLIETQGY